MDIRVASAGDLDTPTLYRILRLRAEVFSVEQQCAYNDLDGRDLEPLSIHLWIDLDPAASRVTAAARLLTEPDGSRVLGRIATEPAQRRRGLAGELIGRALDLSGADAVVRLNGQSHLEAWYRSKGFERCGDDFLEDGIPHVPMVRNG